MQDEQDDDWREMAEPSKIGLGRAELWHGDCLELIDRFPDDAALVCDPPYGIGYEYREGQNGSPNALISQKVARPMMKGDDTQFDPSPFLRFPHIALFGADHFKNKLPAGGMFLCWDKSLGHGSTDCFVDSEHIWITRASVKRTVFRMLWKGIMREMRPEDKLGKKYYKLHVSQKPVALMRWVIESLRLRPGSLVIDPFMGSGSTGLAALSLGHRFVGVEYDETHFATACARIKQYHDTLCFPDG